MFVKLKGNKTDSGFSQTQQYIYLLFILTACFRQLTIIRPSSQNSESGVRRANSVHAPDSRFCKDGLMMVD